MSAVLRRSDVVRILARQCSLTREQAEAVNELFGSLTDKGALGDPGLIQEAVTHGIAIKLRSFGEFNRRLWKGKRIPKAPAGVEATNDAGPLCSVLQAGGAVQAGRRGSRRSRTREEGRSEHAGEVQNAAGSRTGSCDSDAAPRRESEHCDRHRHFRGCREVPGPRGY